MTDELPLASNPPIEPAVTIDETPRSSWPTIIGSLSLVYAIIGLLCALGLTTSGFLTEFLMSMGGMKVQVPLVVKLIGAVFGLLLLIAGIMLITGAVGTLRRKRSGPATIRMWVVYRIAITLLNVVVTVLTQPVQVQYQQTLLEAQRQKLKESGSTQVIPEVSDAAMWNRTMIFTGVFSALFIAYPVFLGIYLSRRRIMREVSEWP